MAGSNYCQRVFSTKQLTMVGEYGIIRVQVGSLASSGVQTTFRKTD